MTLATGFHLGAHVKEEGENSPLKVVFDLYMCAMAHAHTHHSYVYADNNSQINKMYKMETCLGSKRG